MLILPVTNLPAYSFDISLDGRAYRFFFTWNSIYEFYTMDIRTITNVTIIRGVKVIINYELIRRYAIADLPPGGIIPVDKTESLERVEKDGFGTDVQLIYIPREELDAII